MQIMMKKKILGLALAAISLVAFSGVAHNPSSGENAPKTESMKRADKNSRKEKKNPFEGLELTAALQTQLSQLNSRRKATRQQQAQARKEEKQRKNADNMAQRRSEVKSYLDEVKAIVGPDQYVVFLENVYVNGGSHSRGKAMKHGSRKGGHGHAKGKGCKEGQHNGDKAGINADARRSQS